ncbi:cytochrome c biogenesis protein ResB [Geobacter sp.]|uniref:cytochrome c biogenesis protein ResB n=1 Tax=Geobacter sp. TaxID=46610 RepID=UPI00261D58F7|nr:cytochrome c biogenesis protein ResB [Geobacter sp.]
MTTDQRRLSQFLWDFLCSLKLTMFLLITLAATSIIGTVVPQGSPPPEYLQSISETKLKLYQALGFFDMYHSWWFMLLLALLSLNLVACSIKRLPHIWKTITRPMVVMDAGLEKTLSNLTTIKTQEDAGTLRDRVAAVLKAEFAKPAITEADGAFHLFAQKTPWCRLAVYAVHLSVVIIFIGAIIGSLFGYKGYVNILEGESVDKVISRSDREIDLGFAVRCENFSVAYYDTGAPKEFKSILTVLENGRPVDGYNRVPIIVNNPLTYKGITFYQSSYGKAGEYQFTVSDINGGNPVLLTVGSNSSARLPDGSEMHVLETTPDIATYAQGLSGPAARVETHTPSGKTESFIVYANHPELNVQHARHSGGPLIHYRGGEERMYTGLQVAKDPGVWVVWLGCLLMVAGIYAAFFMSHRRIWVRIKDGTVTVGGNSSKNQGGFRSFMERLVTKIKDQLAMEEK